MCAHTQILYALRKVLIRIQAPPSPVVRRLWRIHASTGGARVDPYSRAVVCRDLTDGLATVEFVQVVSESVVELVGACAEYIPEVFTASLRSVPSDKLGMDGPLSVFVACDGGEKGDVCFDCFSNMPGVVGHHLTFGTNRVSGWRIALGLLASPAAPHALRRGRC